MPNTVNTLDNVGFSTLKVYSHPSVPTIGTVEVHHLRGGEVWTKEYYAPDGALYDVSPDWSYGVVSGKEIDVYFIASALGYTGRPEEAFVRFTIQGGEGVVIDKFELSNNCMKMVEAYGPQNATWEDAIPNVRHVFTNTQKDEDADWGVACHIHATCEEGIMSITDPFFAVTPPMTTPM